MTTPISDERIAQLQATGCYSDDWSMVNVHPDSDLSRIRRVNFEGRVSIGRVQASDLISDCTLADCTIGDHPRFERVSLIKGVQIGNHVTLSNVGRITAHPGATCGTGVRVSVLDESGSRPVFLYPELSAQMAMLMALNPEWSENKIAPLTAQYALPPGIGDNSVLTDCGVIEDTHIGHGIRVEGASVLRNGSVVNTASGIAPLAYIGVDVDARDFIVLDGHVDSGAKLRRCFVGQAAEVGMGFVAHDTLMFANSAFECGESCSVLAGPYSVSHHKSSLLIAVLCSFFNAGSGTNSSNHMYRLGPIHWGVMRRGVKTASSAYIMWGGRIGAFSMVMGQIKSHPDTSDFPFSYVFGDPEGKCTVVPGVILKSCVLERDQKKWITRDRRRDTGIRVLDHITADMFNPRTISSMMRGLKVAERMLAEQPEAQVFTLGGFRISRRHLEEGCKLYKNAILSYLHTHRDMKKAASGSEQDEWADLSGQLITHRQIEQIISLQTIEAMQQAIDGAFAEYEGTEAQWIADMMSDELRSEAEQQGQSAYIYLQRLAATDRDAYMRLVRSEYSRFTLQETDNDK